ncbi:hypothetical protein BGZ59_011472 [Podila verticillata]|nr:hypothetical protein BGZ59_011472 [Podila verticillata]
MTSPPPLPQRRNSASSENVEPYVIAPPPIVQSVSVDDIHLGSNESPPPLPKRQSQQTLPTAVTPPMNEAPSKFLSPTGNGAYPERPLTPRAPSVSTTATSNHTSQVPQAVPNSARSKEEVSFEFDRHVQEIRRRRTVLKKAPLPDRDNFTHIEAESGKRVLDVRMYIQASLARDDRVRKPEPLHWSKMKALLSRLYDTSSPAQSLGLYVERIMYWKNPPETFAWFALYFTLWFYGLWLPGFIMMFSLRILNNRFGFLGGFKQAVQISDQALTPAQKESELKRRSTKMHSQLRELIHSKDLTDWISQMTKIWGPYCQALLEENICYLERLKKYVPVTFMLSCNKYYPRFSHVFSPVEWILWGVPTNAELAVEQLTQQEDDRRRSMEVEGSIRGAVEPFTTGEHESHQDSTSFVSGLSPASKIKYEYQKRRGRSPSDVSHVSDALSMEGLQEKSEFHCLLRGKPGKLVVTEEALLFRSAKLLGREIEAQLTWEMIDTIKKSKTMDLGIWSMPGIEVTDINGRVIVFQNVVKRDDAFRKLVVTSGKKWSHVN